MKIKSFGVKYRDEGNGSIEGYASTWIREPDSYGDVVKEGAFTNTLKERWNGGKGIPLLWAHQMDQLKSFIGSADADEDEKGLHFVAKFDDTEEAQRVRAGEDDLHAAGGEDVRQQRSPLDEVLHQRDLIDEDVLIAPLLQLLQILIQLGQIVPGGCLNEGSPGKLGVGHFRQNLPDQGGFTGTAQAVEDEHPILHIAVHEIMELLIAGAFFVSAYRCRIDLQCLANADIHDERFFPGSRLLRSLLFQCLQFCLQSFPRFDLLSEGRNIIFGNILLPALFLLRPAVIEIDLAADGLLGDRTRRQRSNPHLQFGNTVQNVAHAIHLLLL